MLKMDSWKRSHTMRILLAVDSIITLKMLIDKMATRLWPQDTRARVLSVVEDDEVPQGVWRAAGYQAGAVRQEMRRRGEQISALAVESLRQIGIPAEVAIMRGDPSGLIPYEARKWSADLILIRAHNRMDLRRWMLGSVAKSVIRSAPCSVEVVRDSTQACHGVAHDRMRILLATDGTESSAAAAKMLAAGAWPERAEVKVISAVNPLVYSLEEDGLFGGGATERAHRAIGVAMQVLKDAGLRASGEVIAGRSAGRIIEEAKKWRADLIVVGSNDRRGFRRWLSGSVSETVANRAHCSVKIVRGRGVAPQGKSLATVRSPSFKRAGTVNGDRESIGLRLSV
jgi:nucleotide-binding universal stress UspA family protein